MKDALKAPKKNNNHLFFKGKSSFLKKKVPINLTTAKINRIPRKIKRKEKNKKYSLLKKCTLLLILSANEE
ncbi:MAG: hypothetical protein P9M02_03710 [Candidatus Susulua stagnicola]|nr:hypothetical protein [Candidatus Susulua stagnicola]